MPKLWKLCYNKSLRQFEEVPDELCHFLSPNLSNTSWAKRGSVNTQAGNAFGAVTRIIPIINNNIFGTLNFVVHNGITLGAGIGVGFCDCVNVIVVLYPSILLHLVPCQTIVPQIVTVPRR